MRIYRMYRKDTDIVAVKDGFSYPGFFFTWFWAFAKRLWGVGIFFFLLNIVAFSFFAWMPYKNFPAIHHLPSLWMTVNFSAWMAKALLGYFGNRLKGNQLIRQGYTRLPGMIRAKNIHEATIIGMSLPADHQNNLRDGRHATRWIGGTILVLWSFFLYVSPLPNMAIYPAVHDGASKNNNSLGVGRMLEVGNRTFPLFGTQQPEALEVSLKSSTRFFPVRVCLYSGQQRNKSDHHGGIWGAGTNVRIQGCVTDRQSPLGMKCQGFPCHTICT